MLIIQEIQTEITNHKLLRKVMDFLLPKMIPFQLVGLNPAFGQLFHTF